MSGIRLAPFSSCIGFGTMRKSDEGEDVAKALARTFDLASRPWPIAHAYPEEIKFKYYNRKDNVRAVGSPKAARGTLGSAPMTVAIERTGFSNIVRLVGVQKYFGAVHALRNVNLSVGCNEIVGLIGDNGAGKSTLIKTITGVFKPTSGRMFVRDKEIDLEAYSVGKAHHLSIETVYQDKSLGERQPLWRNFFVGRQITNRFGFINVKKEKEIAAEILLNTIGFRGAGLSVDSTVQLLSGGERQGISIGRAMHFNSDLIILDEPTAALGVKEVRKVLDFVRRIKESGRASIYIEHNLAHVHEVADRLIVLDRGEIVSEMRPQDMTVAQLTKFLVDLQHKR
jgi:simple sugar transport system ATP-binding protein